MDDFLVLGGGVIGLSLAYELAGQGAQVRILERGVVGREASWAGAGILPPGNIATPRTPYEALIRLSHDLHPQWAAQLREETGIDNEYRRCGGLYLAESIGEADAVRQQAEDWQAQGISVEMAAGPRLREIEPTIAPEVAGTSESAALFAPDEAQLRNPRHLRALVTACRRRGVLLTEGEGAEEFDAEGPRLEAVRTATGRFPAGAVCLASGSWSGPLLARLGIDVPLKPIRGQMALVRSEARIIERVINVGKRYLVPRADGRTLIGSTEEDVGFAKQTTAEAIGELLRFATRLVPALATATLETSWAGLRPMTPDERPYLGRLPGFDNAFVAAGHFRSGLQFSPATAVVMRQLMLGQTPAFDLTPFHLDRATKPAPLLHGR